MPGKNFSRGYFENFFIIFSQKIEFVSQLTPKETVCLKSQILFSRKNRKNISLSSAEFAHSLVNGETGAFLTLFLLNPDMPTFANSVDPDQLASKAN